MGYHVRFPGDPGYDSQVPAIVKDGGTGAWREAKKVVRSWYLEKAANLRSVSEKMYFKSPVEGE